jgi:SnoaL-like domain
LFAPDVIYDLEAFGGSRLRGIEAIRDAALALGPKDPVGHHVTNIVVTETGPDEAEVHSKGLGIGIDRSVGSVTYHDVVRRRNAGWRITWRKGAASPRTNSFLSTPKA